jgi:AcrR family transcriptional regulator
MTRVSGGTDAGARPGWRWDVALSFAGAQRDYVGQVAEALQGRGVRCFHDADEQIELWGRYLAEELPLVYGEQAAAVVVFMSAEYAARDWTRLERQAALARAVRERREYVLPARFDDTPLPGLLSDMVTVDLRTRAPEQFADMITGKLAALGVTGPALLVTAGDLARAVEVARPAGAVRAGEADPRRLGVHAAISVPGVPGEVPPEYVPRDVDAGEFGVRARVAAAAERGGFVLLVGGSSVGKTRCAVEAVRALLPDWWLVHPADLDEVAALARAPVPRTVVWLDELRGYLDGEHGLTGGMIRALLNAPHPAVIIGTLWPELYTAYTTMPEPGGADSHAQEREVLDLADVVRIGPAFSPAEQDRALTAAARDRRLAIALDASGYGLTQTLAAAPQLVARWEDAKTANPYAWAVLTAALDVARLGARAPLSTEFLRAAAPDYCTSQQQAEAPDNWFEHALAYATAKLYGAAAALSPAGAGAGRMGQIAGYTVADYLIQHASRERRSARVPASTWDEVKERMLETGRDLALEAGVGVSLEEVRMEEVIRRAGVPHASVYRLWPYKEDFVNDLLCRLAATAPASGERVYQEAGETAAAVILANQHRLGTVGGRRAVLREAIRRAIAVNFPAVINSRPWQVYLALISTLSATGDSGARARLASALEETEISSLNDLARLIQGLAGMLGFRPRDGYTFEHLAIGGNAVVQGLTLRGMIAAHTDGPHRTEQANLSIRELLDTPLEGPGLDTRTDEWSFPAAAYLAIIEAFIEPDPDYKFTPPTPGWAQSAE